MKKPFLIVAIAALAACNGADSDSDTTGQTDNVAQTDGTAAGDVLAGEEPGFEAVAPGTYEVVAEGGDTHQLTIHPGLTWSMVFADGEAAGGTIYMQGGETCFVTEGEEGADCFTAGEIREDGTMANISSAGTVMNVRPIGGQARTETGSEI